LLQSHGENLSNDELRDLAEQRIQSESEAFDAEEETSVTDLATEFLSHSITAIMQIMENVPDQERSSKAK
jgi:hypothetical protein